MTLTQKETDLLKDLKSQEEICITKYATYGESAADPTLKNLFSSIRTTEENHLSTVSRILKGEEVAMSTTPPPAGKKIKGARSTVSAKQKQKDAYLCRDALAMEKHVSSVYDTAIFEFTSGTLRDTLNHIQKEEQNHGDQLYQYLSKNKFKA